MSKYIPGNQKHLTLEDREYIKKSLDKGQSFKDIAMFLCKDPTTISKEVKLHRLDEHISARPQCTGESMRFASSEQIDYFMT